MRILFVVPHYKPYLGGIERVIEKLGQEFLKCGQVEAVGVLTTHWAFPRQRMSGLPTREIIDEMEVFRISSWPRAAPPFFQVPLVWFSPLSIRQVIKEFEPDVIQLMSDRWFWGNFWAWVFRGSAQIAFSLSFHELNYGGQARFFPWAMKQFLRPINAFLTRAADWVQVITQYEKQLVQPAYFTPEKKIRVIPWGVLKQRDSSFARPRDQGFREITVLCVGRLSEHKGQAWLLEGFAEVQQVITRKARLVFVGADEGELERLTAQSLKLGIRDSIEFAGEVSDARLEQYYREADIFALFPEYEAFGLVFLEAMAHGVPVLTHKVGAIEEVLKDKAMLIRPYNKMQAKVALTKLIEDDDFRLQLGQAGRKYVLENFSWEKTANRFLSQYEAYQNELSERRSSAK